MHNPIMAPTAGTAVDTVGVGGVSGTFAGPLTPRAAPVAWQKQYGHPFESTCHTSVLDDVAWQLHRGMVLPHAVPAALALPSIVAMEVGGPRAFVVALTS